MSAFSICITVTLRLYLKVLSLVVLLISVGIIIQNARPIKNKTFRPVLVLWNGSFSLCS